MEMLTSKRIANVILQPVGKYLRKVNNKDISTTSTESVLVPFLLTWNRTPKITSSKKDVQTQLQRH